VRQAAKVRIEQRLWRSDGVPDPHGQGAEPWPEDRFRGFDPAPYIASADAILAGGIRAFTIDNIGFPPAWNRCAKTGREAPLVFGKTLAYRDERVVGNIKYLWEPNRHLELVTLAQAWRLSRDQRFADGIVTYLESWFSACPFPLGPNWTSSLEHGLRLVNWSFAWQLIGGDSSELFQSSRGQRLRTEWLKSVYLHQQFIAGHLSFYSSANNHLLGEYLGLFVASLTWPYWDRTPSWHGQARTGFLEEALRQNSADGVNREQAVYYQHEVMDMMLVAGLMARANDADFGAEYWDRFERLCEFLAALMDVSGKVPMIGDADDAQIIRLDPTPAFDPYRSLLASGSVLFQRGDFAAKAGCLDEKTRWLIPDATLPAPAAIETRMAFPEGGYFLLGDRLNEFDETRLVCDCGPLGYLSTAAHGHADALSFTLSSGGREWLVDPGTFAYHTDTKWRDYFRGTGAHNTLRIDEVDQSVIGGSFLWLQKAQATLKGHDPEAGIFEGEHDGYTRLKDPVRHRRRITLNKDDRSIQIQDWVECAGPHRVDLCFQFAETCDVTIDQDSAVATQSGEQLTISCAHPTLSPSLHRGSEDPVAGWVSRAFDVKVAAPMVRWCGLIEGATSIDTTIRLPG
jgi:hypothetical protein